MIAIPQSILVERAVGHGLGSHMSTLDAITLTRSYKVGHDGASHEPLHGRPLTGPSVDICKSDPGRRRRMSRQIFRLIPCSTGRLEVNPEVHPSHWRIGFAVGCLLGLCLGIAVWSRSAMAVYQ